MPFEFLAPAPSALRSTGLAFGLDGAGPGS